MSVLSDYGKKTQGCLVNYAISDKSQLFVLPASVGINQCDSGINHCGLCNGNVLGNYKLKVSSEPVADTKCNHCDDPSVQGRYHICFQCVLQTISENSLWNCQEMTQIAMNFSTGSVSKEMLRNLIPRYIKELHGFSSIRLLIGHIIEKLFEERRSYPLSQWHRGYGAGYLMQFKEKYAHRLNVRSDLHSLYYRIIISKFGEFKPKSRPDCKIDGYSENYMLGVKDVVEESENDIRIISDMLYDFNSKFTPEQHCMATLTLNSYCLLCGMFTYNLVTHLGISQEPYEECIECPISMYNTTRTDVNQY